MRTDQPSPLRAPTSPLSPAPTHPALAPPPPPHSTARRARRNTHRLRLTNLSAFPPSSAQTPSALATDTPKLTPRHHADAQLALHNFQRELIANATRAAAAAARTVSTTVVYEPLSPRLLPLGSPGPVTPLVLEEGEAGYLVAGLEEGDEGEGGFVGRLMVQEEQRSGRMQTERVAAAVEPAGGRG